MRQPAPDRILLILFLKLLGCFTPGSVSGCGRSLMGSRGSVSGRRFIRSIEQAKPK